MTVQVTMLQTRLGEDGELWTPAGSPYTASDAFAAFLVAHNLATGTLPQVAQSALTAAQVQAVQALIDGSGVQVAPSFLGVYGGVVFDAGSGNVMPTMRVVVNAATDVTAAQQIASGGAQAFTTTISGASTTGEVMVLTTGAVDITSVHVGFSTGASQAVSEDATITVNEMVRFDFDAADDVNSVRIHFSPPRSSGRYIDVSCVGQQRVAA
jgi:hypothetical protein